jgi:general secretion pathway protein A
MYESYWQLFGTPFENAGDGRWFAETAVHGEALARLEFLVEYRRRIGLFRGAEGTGKSTILQQLLRRRKRYQQEETAFIDLTSMESHELLWHLAAGLHLGPNDSDTPLQLWRSLDDALNGLRYAGRQTVFLFDHFDPRQQDVLRVVERLQHLESALSGWVTTIIAIRNDGSLERMNSLVELSDFRIELQPLDQKQTSAYIQELLKQAGAQQQIFVEEASAQIHQYSGGIPREINRICDFALLAAMQEQRRTIDEEIVSTVAEELQFQSFSDGERIGSQELTDASVR